MPGARTDWIESAGGPLVVMPRSVRADWNGIAGDDYQEACRVDDYLGLVARAWGDVLVLGDEPLRTAVVHRPDGPAIVRWMYAPSEERLLDAALNSDLDQLPPVEMLSIRVLAEPYVLFDSGASGATANRLEFIPPTGTRTVRTYVIKDEENEVGLILHRFGV